MRIRVSTSPVPVFAAAGNYESDLSRTHPSTLFRRLPGEGSGRPIAESRSRDLFSHAFYLLFGPHRTNQGADPKSIPTSEIDLARALRSTDHICLAWCVCYWGLTIIRTLVGVA